MPTDNAQSQGRSFIINPKKALTINIAAAVIPESSQVGCESIHVMSKPKEIEKNNAIINL